jgi:uncharacterized protein YbcI
MSMFVDVYVDNLEKRINDKIAWYTNDKLYKAPEQTEQIAFCDGAISALKQVLEML